MWRENSDVTLGETQRTLPLLPRVLLCYSIAIVALNENQYRVSISILCKANIRQHQQSEYRHGESLESAAACRNAAFCRRRGVVGSYHHQYYSGFRLGCFHHSRRNLGPTNISTEEDTEKAAAAGDGRDRLFDRLVIGHKTTHDEMKA